MAQQAYTPTASQYASAASHLDLRHDPLDGWRIVRIAGVRYVRMVSGTSGKVYLVRADARGCECRWSQKTSDPCSHRVALELAALEDDLIESQQAEPVMPFSAFRDLYPGCIDGCGQVTERGNSRCLDCESKEVARLETAGKMALAGSRYSRIWTEG